MGKSKDPEFERQVGESSQPARMSGFKRFVLVALVVVFVGSVAARALSSSQPTAPARSTTSTVPGHGLVQGGTTSSKSAVGEPDTVQKSLPYLTEASFFGLIGFALGYAVRKIVKLGLILIAVFFVGVQVLSHFNVVQVDWGKAQQLANDFLFNIGGESGIVGWIKAKLPSAGSLGAGYLLGFRRG